jgi:hypothetical protein
MGRKVHRTHGEAVVAALTAVPQGYDLRESFCFQLSGPGIRRREIVSKFYSIPMFSLFVAM